MKIEHRLAVLAVAVAVGLAGCGDKKAGEAKATQVAAKVNGDEVTVHQLNFELARLGNISPEQAKLAASQVLKNLVDQQLLLQKAVDTKLDSDPNVVQALEAARRQVLAQAYLKRLTEQVAVPTEAEVVDYYQKNPALFAERRIYRLQEITVQAGGQAEAVKAKLAQSRNLNEFAAWLKDNHIPAHAAQSVKPAEQLPLELLPRLHALKDGQAITVATGDRLSILFLAGSQNQPVELDKAKAAVGQYLANARKREAAEAELKKLREAGKIEYLGEYAELGKTAAPAAAAKAVAAPPAAPAADQGAIAKGVQGLN